VDSWWQSLSGVETFFWVLAVFSTTTFLIQSLLTLLGLNAESDADAGFGSMGDGSADALDADLSDLADEVFWGYFSFRNLIAFFLGFSWTGIACLDGGWSLAAAILLGVLAGLVFVAVVMAIMNAISKLQNSGNLDLRGASGNEATVSIAIPANRSGKGKVRFTLQGRLAELEAETEGEILNRNDRVFVIRQIDGQTLLVGKHV
jgi:membrane protein implicated in regulation of membrane protease activity